MIIGSFGKHPDDGRPQLIVGLTQSDIVHLMMAGTLDVNETEPTPSPLGARVILQFSESEDAIRQQWKEITGTDGIRVGGPDDDDGA